tara:strand:- start:203 stop:772 length:570 start_codon:yes stop_codon:yes gene_type:complete
MPQLTPEQRAQVDKQNLANILKKAGAGKVLSDRDVKLLDQFVEVKNEGQGSAKATEKTLIQLSDLARICKTDHRDVTAFLTNEKINYKDGPRRSKLFPLFDAVEALVQRKGTQSAVEQRNLADAKLKEAQRLKIEGEWRPITESRQLAARMAAITTEVIETSDLPLEDQNKLVEQLRSAMAQGMEVSDE